MRIEVTRLKRAGDHVHRLVVQRIAHNPAIAAIGHHQDRIRGIPQVDPITVRVVHGVDRLVRWHAERIERSNRTPASATTASASGTTRATTTARTTATGSAATRTATRRLRTRSPTTRTTRARS